MTTDVHISEELAAGGLVWRLKKDEVQVLLVHRPRYDDWGLPKGRLDAGESLLQCALREVEEETGFRCELGRKLPPVVYVKPSGRHKRVALWAMQAVGGAFEPNREVDRIKWSTIPKALGRLTYDADREILRNLGSRWTNRPRRVLLVRHAHAGNRHTSTYKNDSKRPLSTKGKGQAAALAEILHPFSIDRAISSPAVRCVDTIAELARTAGNRLKIEPLLWEDTPLDDAERFVLDAKRGTTLLSSHGPLILGVLRRVLGTRRSIPHEKGSTWVLDVRKGSVFDANYLSPGI